MLVQGQNPLGVQSLNIQVDMGASIRGIIKALFPGSYLNTALLLSALISITLTSRHAYWPRESDS